MQGNNRQKPGASIGGDRGPYRGGKWRGGRGGVSKYSGNRKNGPGPRPHIDDDDDAMGQGQGLQQSRSRFTPYLQGQHRRGKYNYRGRKNTSIDAHTAQRLGLPVNRSRERSYNSSGINTSSSGWYKVTIPHGKKTEKDFLLKNINSLSTVPFFPIQFHYVADSALFYINDKDAAEGIRTVSRKITSPTGFKVIIMVRSSEPPKSISFSDAAVAQLETCLSQRYDAVTCTLRINALYKDQSMMKEGYYMSLTNYKVARAVLDTIKKNIPDVQGIDLSDNKLENLDNFQSLNECAPHLIKLSVGNNKIRTESHLSSLKGLNLQEIYLDGNPVCDNYKDEKSYISAIRKKFPKVMRLVIHQHTAWCYITVFPLFGETTIIAKLYITLIMDGHELPPSIKFDIDDQIPLPVTQPNHFKNEQLQSLVGGFLQLYISVYDGESSSDRERLLDAYHENAVFSLAIGFNKIIQTKQTGFKDYYQESRNLRKVADSAGRTKTLRIGRANVISLLRRLPTSEHDLTSLSIDISLESPSLLCFSLCGFFKERIGFKSSIPLVRAFSRVFLAVPSTNGSIVIVNEQYEITNPTAEQSQNAFKSPAPPTPSPSPVPGSSASTSSDIVVKQQMVIRFAEASGMNLTWAEQCLVQNDWEYEKSGQCFLELKEKGSIPPEAFAKS